MSDRSDYLDFDSPKKNTRKSDETGRIRDPDPIRSRATKFSAMIDYCGTRDILSEGEEPKVMSTQFQE